MSVESRTDEQIELTDRQKLTWDCPADEILFGGAKGGGKSFLLLLMIIKQVAMADAEFQRTGITSTGYGVIFRKTFTRLGDLVFRAKRMFKMVDPEGVWNETNKSFTFACGYRFRFAQLANPDAHEDWQGQEMSFIGFDQVEEIPWSQYEFILMQLRSTDPVFRGREQALATANPLGEYAKWVKDRFVKAAAPETFVDEDFKLPDGRIKRMTRVFIPSKLKDNPHLWNDGKYAANLMRMNKTAQEAFLFGNWDVVMGGFFDVLESDFHIRPIRTVPASWELFMCGDWGSRSPSAWLLCAIDNDGNMYCIDEVYCPGETGSRWGQKLLARFEKLRINPDDVCGPLDPEAWTGYGADGIAPGDKMVQMGLRWFKADKGPNSRVAHLTEIRERLLMKWCPDCKGNARHKPDCEQRWPVQAGILIDPRCKMLIEEMQQAVASETNPNDVAESCAKHALDALGYGCAYKSLSETAQVKVDETMDEWQSSLEAQDALRTLLGRGGNPSFNGYG